MFFTLLAALQLQSTWATTLSKFDAAVNSEIHKLEDSLDPSHQKLNVRDIKVELTGGFYYGFIVYEVEEKHKEH
jgi:hypothetical protein